MRTIHNLNVPKETDLTKFPDSTIINETDTDAGTPVVREIYGDVLTNIYKLLRITGITANGTEDNETNGYQFVSALKRLTNELNDVEQLLSLTGTVFSVPMDLALLPAKYVCVVRSSEAYVASNTYTFKGNGTGGQEYGFTCASGFASGDELLLIIDPAGVRAYNLNNSALALTNETFIPFGAPLAYSDDKANIRYQSEGILFTDLPALYDLQAPIRTLESDGTILVYEMMQIGAFILCFTYSSSVQRYRFYKYALTDLTTPILCTLSGGSFPVGSDNKPNVYTDGTRVVITNQTGNSANNYILNIYTLNITAGTLTLASTVFLDNTFQKTTNAVVVGNYLYTFIAGVLIQYHLGTGTKVTLGSYPAFIGILFKIKNDVWFSSGEVAKRWTLPT